MPATGILASPLELVARPPLTAVYALDPANAKLAGPMLRARVGRRVCCLASQVGCTAAGLHSFDGTTGDNSPQRSRARIAWAVAMYVVK